MKAMIATLIISVALARALTGYWDNHLKEISLLSLNPAAIVLSSHLEELK